MAEKKTQHWAVSVDRNGENVVTIESRCLSGRDLSPDDEQTIRDCARQLLAFVGDAPVPREQARYDRLVAIDGEADRAEAQKQNTHDYENDYGSSDCRNGCGCWATAFSSGGPDGVDPFGACPKAAPSRVAPPSGAQTDDPCWFHSIEGVASCGAHRNALRHTGINWRCETSGATFTFGTPFGAAASPLAGATEPEALVATLWSLAQRSTEWQQRVQVICREVPGGCFCGAHGDPARASAAPPPVSPQTCDWRKEAMTDRQIKKLANRIARDVFTSGNGKRADRLVLAVSVGRDLGGWGERPLAGRIRKLLVASLGDGQRNPRHSKELLSKLVQLTDMDERHMATHSQPSSLAGTEIATLIASWREAAYRSQAEMLSVYPFGSPRAKALRECADALESLLPSLAQERERLIEYYMQIVRLAYDRGRLTVASR